MSSAAEVLIQLALARCGWVVYPSRAHSWRCNLPFGHDGPHGLRHRNGHQAASAEGYAMPRGAS